MATTTTTVWGTMDTGRVVRVVGFDLDPGTRTSDRQYDMVVIGLSGGRTCRVTARDFVRFDLVVEGVEPPVKGPDISDCDTQPFACYRDEVVVEYLAA